MNAKKLTNVQKEVIRALANGGYIDFANSLFDVNGAKVMKLRIETMTYVAPYLKYEQYNVPRIQRKMVLADEGIDAARELGYIAPAPTLNTIDKTTQHEYESYADVISRTCGWCDTTRDYAMCVTCGGCHSCCQCGKPTEAPLGSFVKIGDFVETKHSLQGIVDLATSLCVRIIENDDTRWAVYRENITSVQPLDDSFEWNVDEQDWCGAVTAAVLETQQNYILDTQRLVLWKDCLSHGQAFILSETGQLAFVIVYCYAISTDIPDAALAKHEEQLKAGRDYVAMQEARVRRAGPRVEKPNGNIRPEESRMKQK